MNLNGKVKHLKESPLFAITLGGKELAHSNFWNWLIKIKIENKHPFVEVFIEDFYYKKNKFIEIKREKAHRDLTIYYEDKFGEKKCYVIENKLKSIPKLEQLEKYKINFNDKDIIFERGILTGLKETIDCNHWDFLSYKSIANRINEIANKIELSVVNKEIICLYAKDLEYINDILLKKLEIIDNIYNIEVDGDLKELKLDDVYLKYLGSKLKAYLENKIFNEMKVELKSKWGLPVINQSFNNGNFTLDIMYNQKKSNETLGSIGVQIEGIQFRLICGPKKNNKIYTRKSTLFNKMLEVGYFCKPILEETNPKKKKIKKYKGKETSMQKEFCSYNIKEGFLVYNYWNIKNKMTFKDLLKEIEIELNIAKKIINRGFTFE